MKQEQMGNDTHVMAARNVGLLRLVFGSFALLFLAHCSSKVKVVSRSAPGKTSSAITDGFCAGVRADHRQILSGDEVTAHFPDPSLENCLEVVDGELKGLALTLPANSFAPDLTLTATYDQAPISLPFLNVAFLRPALEFFNLAPQPKLILKGNHALTAEMTVQLPDRVTAGISAEDAKNLSLTLVLDDNSVRRFNSDDFTISDASGKLVFKTSLWATSFLQLDETPPSASISSTLTGPTNATLIPIKVLWSEAVEGFTAADVTVSGATLQGFTGNGQTFTFNLSPMVGASSISLSIGAGSAKDLVGHANVEAASFAILYDATPPVATLTSTAPATTATSPIPIAISFSKAVSGLSLADFVVSNGSAANLAGSGTSFTFDVTPSGNGVVTVSLPAGSVTDISGNVNLATTPLTRTFNSNLATTTLATTAGAATHTSPIPVTITFSTAVTGFDVSDITVSGGSTANFSGSGTTYTCDVTPSGEGVVRVNVAAAIATTVSTGDDNSAASELAITYDTTAPGVVISSATAATTNVSPMPVTITFSESVTGFVVGDITVAGGSKSNFAGSGTTYTFDLTPSGQGAVTVDVAGGVALDSAGNANTAATQLTRTYDSAGPTVVISSTAPATTNVSPIPVTVTFNEAVTGFVVGDITVTGGNKSNFAGSGTTYTFDLTPSGQGSLSVNIASGVAQDSAGNHNSAATQLTRTYDSTGPVPGSSGMLSLSAATMDGMTVSWSKATDAVSAQADLQYRVYYATTNNLGSVTNIKANGTAANSYTADIATLDLSGLSMGTTYYVNVLVKDELGNEAVYVSGNLSTTADTTAPTPGGSGTVNLTWTGSLLQATWAKSH